MGESQRRKMEEGKIVTFDFSAPLLHMMKGDRNRFATDSQPCATCGAVAVTHYERAVPRAVRYVMQQIVQAAFPQGMGRGDGKTWAAWLEAMDDDAEDKVEVTLGQTQWLKKHVLNDDLKVHQGLAQWREAVGYYLADLCAVEASPPKDEVSAR